MAPRQCWPAQMTHLTQTTRRLRFSWQCPRKGMLRIGPRKYRVSTSGLPFLRTWGYREKSLTIGVVYIAYLWRRDCPQYNASPAHPVFHATFRSRRSRDDPTRRREPKPFGEFKPSDIILQLLNSRTTTHLSHDRNIVISIRMTSLGCCPQGEMNVTCRIFHATVIFKNILDDKRYPSIPEHFGM